MSMLRTWRIDRHALRCGALRRGGGDTRARHGRKQRVTCVVTRSHHGPIRSAPRCFRGSVSGYDVSPSPGVGQSDRSEDSPLPLSPTPQARPSSISCGTWRVPVRVTHTDMLFLNRVAEIVRTLLRRASHLISKRSLSVVHSPAPVVHGLKSMVLSRAFD